MLARHAPIATMSRKGNCWYNAVIVFLLNLRMERVWPHDLANQAEAVRDVAAHIVGLYNRVRIHAKLCWLPPIASEGTTIANQTIELSEII